MQVEGSPLDGILVSVFPDQIRLISDRCPWQFEQGLGGCPRDVFRPNGSRVDRGNPAKSGDTLILYAYGLGLTQPRVTAGEPAVAAEVEALRKPQLILEFSYLASPRPRNRFPPDSPNVVVIEPEYMGFTPGQIGLYQINFVMPKVRSDLRRCINYDTDSNVTISVAGFYSFDGVGFCAEPDAE